MWTVAHLKSDAHFAIQATVSSPAYHKSLHATEKGHLHASAARVSCECSFSHMSSHSVEYGIDRQLSLVSRSAFDRTRSQCPCTLATVEHVRMFTVSDMRMLTLD